MRIYGVHHSTREKNLDQKQTEEFVRKGLLSRGDAAGKPPATHELLYVRQQLLKFKAEKSGALRVAIEFEPSRKRPFDAPMRDDERFFAGLTKWAQKRGIEIVPLEEESEEESEEKRLQIIESKLNSNLPVRFLGGNYGDDVLHNKILELAERAPNFRKDELIRAVTAFRSFKLVQKAETLNCSAAVLGVLHARHLQLAKAGHEIEFSSYASERYARETDSAAEDLKLLEKYRGAIQGGLNYLNEQIKIQDEQTKK